jgi:tetratricopeptide (TPR) repeat protein
MAEDQLKVNPRDADLLSSLGLYHAMVQEKEPALHYMNQSLTAGSNNNEVVFNAAKTENQLGNTDQSLRYLEKAIAGGYSKFYAKDDPGFGNVREDERFRGLVGRR